VLGDHGEVVAFLIGKGAKVDSADRFRDTPLMLACAKGAARSRRCCGADPSFRNQEGRTAADRAERAGSAARPPAVAGARNRVPSAPRRPAARSRPRLRRLRGLAACPRRLGPLWGALGPCAGAAPARPPSRAWFRAAAYGPATAALAPVAFAGTPLPARSSPATGLVRGGLRAPGAALPRGLPARLAVALAGVAALVATEWPTPRFRPARERPRRPAARPDRDLGGRSPRPSRASRTRRCSRLALPARGAGPRLARASGLVATAAAAAGGARRGGYGATRTAELERALAAAPALVSAWAG
jgi:hypothetical protein